MTIVETFFGPYRFLSNFFPCEMPIFCDYGISYPTVEHAYQAHKTFDRSERVLISTFPKPGDAKKYSHTMQVREDWKVVRVGIMEGLLRQKFNQPHLRHKLLATGNALLLEGNTWGDTFWGVCNGKGSNNLGKLLMKIREDHKVQSLLEDIFEVDI